MSNHVKKTKRPASSPTKDKRRTSQPSTPTHPDMIQTVFEPINAEVRPAECHSKKSKKQKKAKKTKHQLKEDKTQERTVVDAEHEGLDRAQALPPILHGSKEVTRKNGDMKSCARKKQKPRDTDDAEDRISEKAAVAESPTETAEKRRPVISKSLQIGKTSYKIVYSTSHGKQIPRFVPEPSSYADKKPMGGDEKTAMELKNGCSTTTPECP